MSTQDSSFFANGNSSPTDPTGFTAWSTPSGNIPFDQGMLGIGLQRGLIGLVDDGTLTPPLKLPALVSYTIKAGIFGGAVTNTGAAAVSTASVGVFGQSGNAKGLPDGWTCGVLGASAGKQGVIGWSSTNHGVEGWSTKSVGVNGASETGIGVYGVSIDSTGVQGASTASKGVYGQSGNAPKIDPKIDNTGGLGGVVGASRDAPGVVGISQKGVGVYAMTLGEAAKSMPAKPAIYAVSTGGGGVVAFSYSSSSTGVFGGSLSAHGYGVVGNAQGDGSGVYGSSVAGAGIIGHSGLLGPTLPNASNIAAVVGTSDQQCGVIGTSNVNQGVYGFSHTAAGVVGETDNPAAYAGVFNGNVAVNGLFSAAQVTANVKAAVVPFPDGSKRLLYCMESPDHWFEDFGTAKLKRGRATVKLDADFGKVIKRGDYHVFLTPRGDCRGLFVRRQGGDSFEVGELAGGTSSVAFSYRIVGKRKDIKTHRRFAKIDIRLPKPPRVVDRRKQASARQALLGIIEKHRGKAKPPRTRRQSEQAG
jgi:hypothetical protein